LDAETARALSGLEANPVIREQYLDFARCRRFRQTLLCHAGLPVVRQADPRKLESALMSTSAAAAGLSDAHIRSDEEVVFRGPQNLSLKTANPVMKAALAALGSAWPERLSLSEVREQVAARLRDAVYEYNFGAVEKIVLLTDGATHILTVEIELTRENIDQVVWDVPTLIPSGIKNQGFFPNLWSELAGKFSKPVLRSHL